MAIDCKKTRRLLDSYHDRQLRGRKFDEVSEHVRQCENCRNELEKLQTISRALKEHYKTAAVAEDFSQVWARVDAAVGASDRHQPEPLLDRLIRILWVPKPAWALAAVVVLVVVAVLTYLPGGPPDTLAANDCIIDSVDVNDSSFMVYEVDQGKMQVIWVMDQQPLSTKEKT